MVRMICMIPGTWYVICWLVSCIPVPRILVSCTPRAGILYLYHGEYRKIASSSSGLEKKKAKRNVTFCVDLETIVVAVGTAVYSWY